MVTITYDHEARRRSYELIAEAFGLGAAAAARRLAPSCRPAAPAVAGAPVGVGGAPSAALLEPLARERVRAIVAAGPARSRSRAVRTTVSACVRAASDVSRPVTKVWFGSSAVSLGSGYPLTLRLGRFTPWGRYLP